MQVRHGLAGRFLAIDDQTVAVGNAQLRRQPCRHKVQVAQQRLIIGRDVGVRRNHFAWNDQDVDGRLWIYVVECDAVLVLVDHFRRDRLIENLQKDVVLEHSEVSGGDERTDLRLE
jgi:hypothetical protein